MIDIMNDQKWHLDIQTAQLYSEDNKKDFEDAGKINCFNLSKWYSCPFYNGRKSFIKIKEHINDLASYAHETR